MKATLNLYSHCLTVLSTPPGLVRPKLKNVEDGVVASDPFPERLRDLHGLIIILAQPTSSSCMLLYDGGMDGMDGGNGVHIASQ